ncbi:hypothetical protein [Microbacterium sp. NPDC096154]|uniref:hypothetical protein n=1 Tax=Microbacterium sp. NPDC096154 TaxID=3155549 RepID=UPI00331B5256
MGQLEELHTMRNLNIILLGMTLITATLTGCTAQVGGETSEQPTSPSQLPGAPEGEVVHVEPARRIDGATEWATDGIVIEVPQGKETRREVVEGSVQLFVYDAEDDGETAYVRVPRANGPVGDADVDTQTAMNVATYRVNGAAVENQPAVWEGWAYANSIRATLESNGESVDMVEFDMRDEGGELLVMAMARTGSGQEVEETWQYEVLRTVRKAP